MHRTLCLLLAGLLLVGCGRSTQHTLASQALASPYSLAEAEKLPKALRIELTEIKGYLFVNGKINGKNGGTMLLDTGSTINILDKGVVNRLGLPQTGEGRTRGIGGVETYSRHAVQSLAIGPLDLGSSQVASLSMYRLTRALRMSVSGLIGSVSLLPEPFAIDYVQRELVIYNRKTFVPPKDAERIRLEFYGRLPAVRAKLANGKEVLLIIDTGMDNAVSLPMSLAGQRGILDTGASGTGQSRGVGGDIQTRLAWLRSLDVFGYSLASVPVTFEPQTHEPRRKDLPVGRIGGELLKGFRLTIDARYRHLWAEFSAPIKE